MVENVVRALQTYPAVYNRYPTAVNHASWNVKGHEGDRMRKLLATVVFVLVSAAVAQAAPLTPPICDATGQTECAPGPQVLPPFPVAGEGFLPVATNSSTGTVGPRVDWIVLPNPGLIGPGAGAFLYIYQIESASGASPLDDGSRDVRGDISRFTLSTGIAFPALHNFTSMGVADGDADNTGERLFFGTAIPTNGDGSEVLLAALAFYGAATLPGHNCGNFANLCPEGGVGGESETSADLTPFGDAEGDEVGIRAVEGSAVELAWDFIRKIIHGLPGTPEESVILWAMGDAPIYGAGIAIDGAPFSPWSSLNPNGRPVPVAATTTVPEPTSLFLLGSGILAAGVITRRLRTRKP